MEQTRIMLQPEYVQLELFDDTPKQGKPKKRNDPAKEPLEKKIERALWLLRTAAADRDKPSNLFFDDFESFHDAVHSIFGDIDCKAFLEQYFGIKL